MMERIKFLAVIGSDTTFNILVNIIVKDSGLYPVSELLPSIMKDPGRYKRLLKEYNPGIVIFDVFSIERDWLLVRKLMKQRESFGRNFILTTPNVNRLERLAQMPVSMKVLNDPLNIDELAITITRGFAEAV